MIKRTIEISSDPAHLTIKNKQLLVKHRDKVVGSVPCEDIGVVIVDHPGTTYSHAALTSLLASGAALVVCGNDHLPAGVLLPFSDHSTVVWRINEQINVSRPLAKQLWQQIVQAKIRNQAAILSPECTAQKKLLALSKQVRSGDTTNIEAQAARVYWQYFLPAQKRFYRNKNGKDGLNAFLNYGYSIIRSAIARAIVSAGLLPTIGLHHRNRSNSFCLADDLIEPFRPIVDYHARDLHQQGHTTITPKVKKALLELLTASIKTGEEKGPLMIAIQKVISSLVSCFSGESNLLALPEVFDFNGDNFTLKVERVLEDVN